MTRGGTADHPALAQCDVRYYRRPAGAIRAASDPNGRTTASARLRRSIGRFPRPPSPLRAGWRPDRPARPGPRRKASAADRNPAVVRGSRDGRSRAICTRPRPAPLGRPACAAASSFRCRSARPAPAPIARTKLERRTVEHQFGAESLFDVNDVEQYHSTTQTKQGVMADQAACATAILPLFRPRGNRPRSIRRRCGCTTDAARPCRCPARSSRNGRRRRGNYTSLDGRSRTPPT